MISQMLTRLSLLFELIFTLTLPVVLVFNSIVGGLPWSIISGLFSIYVQCIHRLNEMNGTSRLYTI